MGIPEFVPVIVAEICIFTIMAGALHVSATGSFTVPVVSGLSLSVLAAVAVLYTAALLVYRQNVLINDPNVEAASWLARKLARMDSVDLTLKEIHVMRVAKAMFHFQLAFYIVYLCHVIVIAVATPEDAEPEADYWLLLFRWSWEDDSQSRYTIIFHCIVTLAMLTLLIVLSYIVYVSLLKPRLLEDDMKLKNRARDRHSRRLVEFNPSAFWFDAVAISQILQYTIWLYSRKLDENGYLIAAFIPWTGDLVFNGIVAESWLYILQQRPNSVSSFNHMKLYIGRFFTPVLVLTFTVSKSLSFVHESFWYVNSFFITGLIISRIIETRHELRGVGDDSGLVRPASPLVAPKTYFGVQQPRVFFKRRGLSKRE
tara:strand:+ start:10847 stop:11956 length:1110 start_codon:yes stop_codon:yes gene_type:complete